MYIVDYLNVNRPIFDLLMFTIFSSTYPPKTNNISSDLFHFGMGQEKLKIQDTLYLIDTNNFDFDLL